MKIKRILSLTLTLILFLSAAVNVGAASACPKNLLVLGDSIATGYGLADGQACYGGQLAQAFELTGSAYNNLAVDGSTSGDLLKELTADNLSAVASADTIVISIGGNDMLTPFMSVLKTALGLSDDAAGAQLEAAFAADTAAAMEKITAEMEKEQTKSQFAAAAQTFSTNCASIMDAIRSVNPRARIYVQNIYNPFSGLDGFETLSDEAESIIGSMNAVITQGASAGGYTVLDIHKAFEGKASEYTNMAYFDIHPNEAGHTAIFNAAYAAITHEDDTMTVSNGKISASISSSAVQSSVSSNTKVVNPDTNDNTDISVAVISAAFVFVIAGFAVLRIASKRAKRRG